MAEVFVASPIVSVFPPSVVPPVPVIESIDMAMKGACNYPMGPFALLDLVGLDTSVAILETIHASFGNPGDAPAQTLLDKVAAGQLGRKTKCGFYTY